MPDPMTAAPSGWLTEEQLDFVESDTDQDVDDLTYLVDHRHFHLLVEMARAALHHEAALETATVQAAVRLAMAYHEMTVANEALHDWSRGIPSSEQSDAAAKARQEVHKQHRAYMATLPPEMLLPVDERPEALLKGDGE